MRLPSHTGTILKFVIACALAFAFIGLRSTDAFAQSFASAPEIFDVRRSLPLDPEEEVTHDFYINAGPEAGFKKGVFVSVVRPVPVHDPIQNKQQATLNIPIGKLQIIHVEKNIAVGRLDSELTDEERPTVEFEAIMIGDRIDVSSITAEATTKKTKSKAKKTTARAADPEPDSKGPAPASQAPQIVVPAAPPAAPPNVAPAPAKPSSAESEESPHMPSGVKNPFPVAIAPDMLRVDDDLTPKY